jgi:putative methyltransferase
LQFTDIVKNFTLKNLFYKREPIVDILASLDNPAVCGFSCYLWNEQYCLELARQIREQWPNCLIVFGGSQVSGMMLRHEFIDSLVLAEGEESFVDILKHIINDTTPNKLYNRSRLVDLNIPSPYTTGVFDKLIEENPNTIWAMTLETNRGCPYACTFCDWGGTTYSKVRKFSIDRIKKEMDWAAAHRVAYMFSADANFGIFKERDLEIAKIMRAAADQPMSMIESINLQFAKNSTEVVFEIAKIVGPYCRGVTVSVQSMHKPTLEAIKRKNLEVNNIKQLMDLSKQHEVGTYTEVIIGLPLETKETWIDGLTDLLELGQHQSIDIWFAQLLENSELASPESRLKYGITSILVKDYMNLDQTNDQIAEHTEIVASTNTMTTDEMIDSYMYAWMIIHWHISGYTQMIAKYSRTIETISYKTFYNKLFVELQQDPVFANHYNTLKSTVNDYLKLGILTGSVGGHALHSVSYKFMYEHKQQAAKLAIQVLKSLVPNIPNSILSLQEMFIIDMYSQYPIILETNYNIDTGIINPTSYTATPCLTEKIEDFYTIRRKGVIKNRVLIL